MKLFHRFFAHMGFYCEFKKHWYVNFFPGTYFGVRSVHIEYDPDSLDVWMCEKHEVEFLRKHKLETLVTESVLRHW